MLVAVDRGVASLASFVAENDDVAIAAVSVAELLLGVELADEERREARRSRVEAIINGLAIQSYDLDVARVHAGLLAHARRSGRPRGAHDLQIAATAIASGRVVITLDRGDFGDLPGVVVRFTS